MLNRESAVKLGAGVLLAVALATSLPALMRSEQPAPLEPDVGLPQAPTQPVAAPPPGPDPAALARAARKQAKRKRLEAAKRRRTERAAKKRRRDRRAAKDHAATPVDAMPTAPSAPVPASPPSPTREDFGIERP